MIYREKLMKYRGIDFISRNDTDDLFRLSWRHSNFESYTGQYRHHQSPIFISTLYWSAMSVLISCHGDFYDSSHAGQVLCRLTGGHGYLPYFAIWYLSILIYTWK